ncbi:hypothetical protein [Salibacterium aidingense]|uniref:hypothetical protein n=1 Tax=Salibacterium aidingense TaxID=384933 RepID=UPI003BC03C8C
MLNWPNIIQTVATIILSSGVLGTIIGLVAKQKLATKLEDIKHENSIILHQHSLFENKKHQVYTEFYHKLLKAHSELTTTVIARPDFRTQTISEIGKHLENIGVEHLYDEIYSLWFSDYEKAIEKLKALDFDFLNIQLIQVFNEANNYLLLNELYFEEDIVEEAKKLLGDLQIISNNTQSIRRGIEPRAEMVQAQRDVKKRTDPQLLDLKKKLRESLQPK